MTAKFETVILILAFPIFIGHVQGQCSQPKFFSSCASACEPTCDGKPEMCILSCVEDCICPSELVRFNNSCVLPTNCPGAVCPSGLSRHDCRTVAPCSTASCPHHPDAVCVEDDCDGCNARFFKNAKEVTDDCDSNCTLPKVFRSCGTACPTTCENRDDELAFCTTQCVPRCACPEPLVEAHSFNSTCVSRCPAGDRDQCEAPKVFTSCGSSCPTNCDNLNPICIEVCVERCACPDGIVEASATNSTCIPATECPVRTDCEAPRIFSTCASECPPNCDDLEPRCNKRCVQKCTCPDDMVESSATNNTCIARTSCPGTNPVPVIIGGGVAAVAVVSILAVICLKMRN